MSEAAVPKDRLVAIAAELMAVADAVATKFEQDVVFADAESGALCCPVVHFPCDRTLMN